MKTWALVPIISFALLAVLLQAGLGRNPRELPSALLNRPAPAFSAPGLLAAEPVSNARLLGKPWVLNVWASWCAGCRVEHEVLAALAQRADVPLVGLNYKDAPDAAKRWLAQLGNPYEYIAVDRNGDIGIDYGVYGVPETFVIDADGYIQWRHAGPLNETTLEHDLLPLLNALVNPSGLGS